MCRISFVIITFLVLLSSQSSNGLEIEKTSILRELISLLDELIAIIKEFIRKVDSEGMEKFEEFLEPEVDHLPDNNSIEISTLTSTDLLYEGIPTLGPDVSTHATTDILSEPIAPDKSNNTIETTYENPTLIRGSETEDKSIIINPRFNDANTSVLHDNDSYINSSTTIFEEGKRTLVKPTNEETTSDNNTKEVHTDDHGTETIISESISDNSEHSEIDEYEEEDISDGTLILSRRRRKLTTTLDRSLNDLEFLFHRKLISEETVQLLKNCVIYLSDLLIQYNTEQNVTVLKTLNNTDLKQLLRDAVLMQKKLQQIQALVDDANSLTVSNQRYIILCGLFLALGILILLMMLCMLFMNKKIQRLVNRISGRDRQSSDYWTMGTATTNSLNEATAAPNNRQSVWDEPPFLSHYISNNYRPNQENTSAANDSRWINPISDHNYFWKRSREWSGRDWNYNRKHSDRIPKLPPQDYYVPTVSGALRRYDPVTLCPLRSN